MSEEKKQRLKECQKNYRESKESYYKEKAVKYYMKNKEAAK